MLTSFESCAGLDTAYASAKADLIVGRQPSWTTPAVKERRQWATIFTYRTTGQNNVHWG